MHYVSLDVRSPFWQYDNATREWLEVCQFNKVNNSKEAVENSKAHPQTLNELRCRYIRKVVGNSMYQQSRLRRPAMLRRSAKVLTYTLIERYLWLSILALASNVTTTLAPVFAQLQAGRLAKAKRKGVKCRAEKFTEDTTRGGKGKRCRHNAGWVFVRKPNYPRGRTASSPWKRLTRFRC